MVIFPSGTFTVYKTMKRQNTNLRCIVQKKKKKSSCNTAVWFPEYAAEVRSALVCTAMHIKTSAVNMGVMAGLYTFFSLEEDVFLI